MPGSRVGPALSLQRSDRQAQSVFLAIAQASFRITAPHAMSIRGVRCFPDLSQPVCPCFCLSIRSGELHGLSVWKRSGVMPSLIAFPMMAPLGCE